MAESSVKFHRKITKGSYIVGDDRPETKSPVLGVGVQVLLENLGLHALLVTTLETLVLALPFLLDFRRLVVTVPAPKFFALVHDLLHRGFFVLVIVIVHDFLHRGFFVLVIVIDTLIRSTIILSGFVIRSILGFIRLETFSSKSPWVIVSSVTHLSLSLDSFRLDFAAAQSAADANEICRSARHCAWEERTRWNLNA
jgi:hypothetical protein